MNRISKSFGLSVCVLVLAPFALNGPGFAHAQTASDTASAELAGGEPFVSANTLKITIISGSAIAGVSGLGLARSQSATAAARSTVQGRTIYSGSGDQLVTTERPGGAPTLSEAALKGTAPGDVVRVEFIAGTEAAMEQAVADLKTGSRFWSQRSTDLKVQYEALAVEARDARSAFMGLPLNDQSRALRYQALEDLTRLESELKSAKATLADAEMRAHAARGQYAAAVKNLEVTRSNHKVNQRFHIIQDVYLDGRANQLEAFLSRAVGETTAAAQASRAIPHIRITRIQIPNSTIVQRSLRSVKAGLWAAGISAALVLEEVTVGEISKTLSEKTQSHYSPEIRVVPVGAAGHIED